MYIEPYCEFVFYQFYHSDIGRGAFKIIFGNELTQSVQIEYLMTDLQIWLGLRHNLYWYLFMKNNMDIEKWLCW